MRTDKWYDQATVCPGHSPGWDGSTVVGRSSIQTISSSNSLVVFRVRYHVLGTHGIAVENGKELFAFQSNPKEEDVEFKTIRTPYGWKIDALLNPHISPRVALSYTVQGKSLRPQDRAILRKLAN